MDEINIDFTLYESGATGAKCLFCGSRNTVFLHNTYQDRLEFICYDCGTIVIEDVGEIDDD